MPFLIPNIFYTFRLLVQAIKKEVVGGGGAEDLWHKLAFGEYQYENYKGDHKSDQILFLHCICLEGIFMFSFLDKFYK